MKHNAWLMVFTTVVLLGLAACSSSTAQKLLSTEVTKPATLAKASEVVGCRYLGEVQGYSEPTRSGNAPLARLTAHDDMLQRAGNMGADFVVLQEYQGNRRVVATGKAYKCTKP